MIHMDKKSSKSYVNSVNSQPKDLTRLEVFVVML